MAVEEILSLARTDKCTDVHLCAGMPVLGRKNHKLYVLLNKILNKEDLYRIIRETTGEEKIWIPGTYRQFIYTDSFKKAYRVTISSSNGQPVILIRILPEGAISPVGLNLPNQILAAMRQQEGLVIIGGQDGQGKTTVLTGILSWLNSKLNRHVLLIQSSLEFQLKTQMCEFHTLELGKDVTDQAQALQQARFMDADMVVMELPEQPEELLALMRFIDAGHLVLASARQNRVEDILFWITSGFLGQQRQDVLSWLKNKVRVIGAFARIPTSDHQAIVSAWEVYRQNKTGNDFIGRAEFGKLYTEHIAAEDFVPMDRSLASLVRQGIIHEQTALLYARSTEVMRQYLVEDR